MREHLREIGSSLYPLSLQMDAEQIAGDMQLLEGPKEDRRPLNVGLLMFSEKTQRFFRYARIEVVDIPDPTGTGMTEKTFTGPLQRQLRDALSYLRNYVLREAVLNNCSGPLRFEMDPDRSYLSVTIPIHEHFAPAKKTDKQLQYEQALISCLENKEIDLTELARAAILISYVPGGQRRPQPAERNSVHPVKGLVNRVRGRSSSPAATVLSTKKCFHGTFFPTKKRVLIALFRR